MKEKLTRRDFLRASALTAAGLALSACGAPTPTTAPPAPTSAPVAPTQAPAAATSAPTQAPAAATSAPTQVAAPTVAKPSPIEITLTRYEHPAQPIQQDAPAHLEITKQTGVKINFTVVPQADFPAKQKVWLATKQVPDLMHCNNTQIRDFAKPEVLRPLTPLIEKYAPNLKKYIADNPMLKKYKMDGEYYYLPDSTYNWQKNAPMPLIRKDLLEKAGLKAPDNLDDLFLVIKELKKVNPSSVGWTNRQGTRWFLTLASYPMGSGFGASQLYEGPYFDWDLNKWLYGPIHDEFKECLGYFARAYKEGVIDPDFAVTTADQWHEKNSSNKGVFSWENMSFCTRWNLALRDKDPKATWGPLPTLGYKKFRRQFDYSGYYDGYAISANAKNPERIIQLMDWMITPPGLDLTNWGIEGTHYTTKTARVASVADYSPDAMTKQMPSERNQILPAVFDKYKTKSDPFRSFQSDSGTGQLDFTVIFDQTISFLWSPPGETDAWFQITINDKALKPRGVQPPFTAAETERLKKLQTDVDALCNPAFDKVILGQMSLGDYDKVVADAKKAGAEEIEKIYNEAEARAK
jgi:ABC-type glycerol-3-phosphate transport system substrate-binding protein